MTTGPHPQRWLNAGFVIVVYLLVYLPIALVVLTSFNEATITTLPMVAPGIVLGVSLLISARYIGFKTGFATLLLGHTLLALPYCTFIVISSLARFDRTLEDAARGL